MHTSSRGPNHFSQWAYLRGSLLVRVAACNGGTRTCTYVAYVTFISSNYDVMLLPRKLGCKGTVAPAVNFNAEADSAALKNAMKSAQVGDCTKLRAIASLLFIRRVQMSAPS